MFGVTMQNSNWKTKKLADIATIFDGQHTTPRYTHTGVPFYSAENISTRILPKCISVKEYESQVKHKKPQKGDILFTRIGSLGKNIIANWDGPYAIYVTIAIIRPSPTILTGYLHHYLDSYTYQRELFSKALLTAYPQKINLEDLLSTKVSYPNIEEQRRIVEVLECWDKGIELVKKLIEQKELQKKYLMQQLLSGNRRLKGFTDKWIIKKLENLLIQINERNRGENCYPILSVTNPRGIVRADEHFSKRVAGKDLSNYKIVHKGNFAYNPSRINVGSIALLDAYIAGLLSPMYVVFKCSQEIDLLYFKFLIQDTTFLTKVANSAQGSVRSTVDFEILSSIKIKFPSSKREQQAIAAVLSSADKEIDLLKQKQAKLEAQKKGLMQVLLTGKIRLK